MVMEAETYDDSILDDACILASVQLALKSATWGDRELYEELISLMDPSYRSLDEREDKLGLIVATLRALSEVVSHIDIHHHQALYTSILGMSFWNCHEIVREALIDLIVCLAVSSGVYLDACLDMLVCHFVPPPTDMNRWLPMKNQVINHVLSALQNITHLVPTAPMRLLPIIERRMPRKHDTKIVNATYIRCMLQLESSAIGDFIGGSLIKKIVERLLDLDVDIRWDEVIQDDCSRGIFDMELEDLIGATACDAEAVLRQKKGAFDGNSVAERLDCLMVIMYQHLESCNDDGRLSKVFETLLDSFQKTVMTAHKSRFVQFLVFYACSLDPEIYGVKFAQRLTDIFLSKSHAPLIRMSAISYLASYLARAKFLPSSFVTDKLKCLVAWCFEYCRLFDDKVGNLRAHQIFYSGCQAVMYILCFRMRSIIDDPFLGDLLIRMPLEDILRHPLDPLKVCLHSIVDEFLRQAKAASLFTKSTSFQFDRYIVADLSKAFGCLERLDMFFPFDPYLLKESDRFIRPNFENWSNVRTTYDNCFSEDEDADEDYEVAKEATVRTDFANNTGNPDREDLHEPFDNEDNLECSINKMSITPKSPFKHFTGQQGQMPAKIRPSMSPEW